jgi:hypothetical protein
MVCIPEEPAMPVWFEAEEVPVLEDVVSAILEGADLNLTIARRSITARISMFFSEILISF